MKLLKISECIFLSRVSDCQTTKSKAKLLSGTTLCCFSYVFYRHGKRFFLPWGPKYYRELNQNLREEGWVMSHIQIAFFCINAACVFLESTFSTIHLYSCRHLSSEMPHLGWEALSTNWGVRSGWGSDRRKVIDSYRRPQLVQPPQPPHACTFFFFFSSSGNHYCDWWPSRTYGAVGGWSAGIKTCCSCC